MTSWMWPCARCRSRIAISDFNAFGARFADADQDAGGERHRQFSGEADGFKPTFGQLVGRAEMHAARFAQAAAGDSSMTPWLAEPGGRRFPRASSRRGWRGQQAGFAQHQRAHVTQVFDRAGGARAASASRAAR